MHHAIASNKTANRLIIALLVAKKIGNLASGFLDDNLDRRTINETKPDVMSYPFRASLIRSSVDREESIGWRATCASNSE